MKWLLIDSDIIIDSLRGLEDARRFFLSLQSHQLYISVVTLTEVYSGKDMRDPRKEKETLEFLSNFEISVLLPVTARNAGRLRRDYNQSFADMVIAASAMTYNFTLVTRNVKHFKDIEGLEILKPY